MNKIQNIPIVLGTAGLIAAAATEYSGNSSGTIPLEIGGIALSKCMNVGKASAQIIVTGDGTLDLSYQCSNDGINFPDASEPALFTGFTKTSGPGADGKAFFAFTPPVCKYIRFKGVETGGADTVTVTGTLCIQ